MKETTSTTIIVCSLIFMVLCIALTIIGNEYNYYNTLIEQGYEERFDENCRCKMWVKREERVKLQDN